jgi:hypothetical protein
MYRLLFLLLFTLSMCLQTHAQSDSITQNLRPWGVHGEVGGLALTLAVYGEYVKHYRKFHVTYRAGIGRTSLQHSRGEGIAENLAFPHMISIGYKTKKKPSVSIELGTGACLDLFENDFAYWSDGAWVEEKEVTAYYRIVPLTLGIRRVNELNFEWRYFLSFHVPFNQAVFPMVGVAFGYLFE